MAKRPDSKIQTTDFLAATKDKGALNAVNTQITAPQITKRIPANRRISAVLLTENAENPSFTVGNRDPQRSKVKSASQRVLFLLIAHMQNDLADIFAALKNCVSFCSLGDGQNLVD